MPSSIDLVGNSVIGFVFGFTLQKARVFDPTVIQSQLYLTDFTMMQTFLAALGTSQLLLGTASLLPGIGDKIRNLKERANKSKDKGYLSVGIGSTLLGVGMALSGACPGTAYVQVGSGIPGSMMVVYGAITGLILFGAIEKSLKSTWDTVSIPKSEFIENDLGISYTTAAMAFGGLMLTISSALKLLPNSSAAFNTGTNLITDSFWSPQIAGMVIGGVQIMSLLLLNEPLGMSSSLVAATSLLTFFFEKLNIIQKDGEWVKSRASMVKKGFYAIAVIAGAFSSALLGSTYGVSTGLLSGAEMPFVSSLFSSAKMQAFIGGVLLWFGARMGGGCTSGHGIGGFAYLKKKSMLAVPCMFAGGIITMHLLKSM